MNETQILDTVIVGGGAAGLTADWVAESETNAEIRDLLAARTDVGRSSGPTGSYDPAPLR